MPTILYEDKHIILVEKPVGVSSQAVENGDSLPHRLEKLGYRVKPVHRLDKPTGGVMAYALTDESAAKLSAIVGHHDQFHKEYLAVIQGCPENKEGTLVDLLYHDVRRNKSYVVKKARKGVREAILDYSVLESVQNESGVFSLINVLLHTGRTHQIRVQFASRQIPLYGDTRYGGVKSKTLGLWSHKLSLPHPITDQIIHTVCEPDWDMAPWCFFKKV